MSENYYSVLGVGQNATPEQIRTAYRDKAKRLHPDRAGGRCEAFQAVQEAYEVLNDPKKRSAYDQFGHAAFEGGAGGGRGGFEFGSFADVFDDLFGVVLFGVLIQAPTLMFFARRRLLARRQQ